MPAQPFGDVVVVIPGIMGSILRKGDDEIWGTAVSALAHAVFSRGKDIKKLQLPDGIGDGPAPDGVTSAGIMPDIHVIPGIWTVEIGYEKLLKYLKSTFALKKGENLVEFGYDWRLSNRYNGQLLKQTVEPILERWRAKPGHADAKLVFVCHSMGGLVARWYIQREGGAELTSKLITLGTPHRGALNAVDSLVNGVKKGIGPFSIDLSSFGRSLPALHQLLPEYACIDVGGTLKKTTEVSLPNTSTAMVADAMSFHDQLDASPLPSSIGFYPIIGINQGTATTAQIKGNEAATFKEIDGTDEKGDSTVPRLAARPKGVAGDSAILHHMAEKHGHLPGNQAVLEELGAIFTGSAAEHRASFIDLDAGVDDLTIAGEPIDVKVQSSDARLLLRAELKAVRSRKKPIALQLEHVGSGAYRGTFADVAPGGYTLAVGRINPAGGLDDVVTTPMMVLDPAG